MADNEREKETTTNHVRDSRKIPIPATIKYRPLPTDPNGATDSKVPSVITTVDVPGGHPCRKCLKDSKIGDKMRLISYDPWLADSPFRQYGPIFIHEEPQCKMAEFPSGSTLPEQQQRRSLSVRAFNKDHMMVGYDVVNGVDLVKCAEQLFDQTGDEHAEYLHVHYAGPGCFAVRIDRGEVTA